MLRRNQICPSPRASACTRKSRWVGGYFSIFLIPWQHVKNFCFKLQYLRNRVTKPPKVGLKSKIFARSMTAAHFWASHTLQGSGKGGKDWGQIYRVKEAWSDSKQVSQRVLLWLHFCLRMIASFSTDKIILGCWRCYEFWKKNKFLENSLMIIAPPTQKRLGCKNHEEPSHIFSNRYEADLIRQKHLITGQ